MLNGTTINLRQNPNATATIEGANMSAGGKITMTPNKGTPQQQWEKVYENAPAMAPAVAAPVQAFPQM